MSWRVIDSHPCSTYKFNVDFDRGGSLAKMLVEFMSEMNLSACDLSFHQYVNFPYERDDGASQSWIDHIIGRESFPLVCPMSIPCALVATYLIIYLCTFQFMLTALPNTVPLLLIVPCHPPLLLALI